MVFQERFPSRGSASGVQPRNRNPAEFLRTPAGTGATSPSGPGPSRLLKNSFPPKFDSRLDSFRFRFVRGFSAEIGLFQYSARRHFVPDAWVTPRARHGWREVSMPWKECSVVDERLPLLGAVLHDLSTLAKFSLCSAAVEHPSCCVGTFGPCGHVAERRATLGR